MTSAQPTAASASARERILSWERLRIAYNLALLVVGVPLAFYVYGTVHGIPEHLRTGLRFSYTPLCVVVLSAVFGVAANALYTLGPLAEIYLGNLMRFGRKERLGLFLTGVLVSLGMMAYVFLTYLTLPDRLEGFDS